MTAPRPEEPIIGDNSLEDGLINTLNKLDNENDLVKIQEIKQETYDQFATKYKRLSQFKYILHRVQFKQGVQLSNKTQLALMSRKKEQKYKNFVKYEDMIASHYYYVSIF